MKAEPGSAPWLLGHELRLAWYGAALYKGGKRRPGMRALAVWLVGWICLHGFAYILLRPLDADGLHDARLAMLAGGVLLICATFMLSNALKASVLALFERGDLDLLLSSPLPSRTIFTVRLLGVVAATAAMFLYLLAPLAHVGLVLGQARWLAIYPAVTAMAALAACAAMLLTLALVRVLGARRTRVVAQVVAAIAGALLFLLSQTYNMLSHDADAGAAAAAASSITRLLAHGGALGPDSALWLPGRAALGQAGPLAGLVLLALATTLLTIGRTHRFFVHGLQQAASTGHVRARPAGQAHYRFRSSLFDTVAIKEWRLIARDPHLISQVLLQLIYLLPLLLLIVRDGGSLPATGAGLTLLCSSLTGSLAWIVISAEDAPDLLLSSPAAQRTIRLAKLAAAALPALLLVALPLLWLIVHMPLPGLLIGFTTSGAVLGSALVVQWLGRPAARSDFKARGKENFLCGVFELLSSLSWGALAWALAALATQAPTWTALAAPIALAAALGTLLLSWLFRRR